MQTASKPKINFRNPLFFIVVAITLALSGCTLDGLSDEPVNTEVSESDLEAASQILGESLSDENSGVMASLNDALSTVSSSGFERAKAKSEDGSSLQSHDDDSNSGRGEERNFSYNYNSETGVHTIAFERIVHNNEYFKSVKDTLKYIFTDNNGQFIAFPRQNKDRIETIDFKGFREGQIESQVRESHFVRQDTFFIDGASEASSILRIDGVHHGRGELSTQNDAGENLQRNYNTKISFLDIQIDKTVVAENRGLEQGVTGTLSWEMVIEKSTNGSTETKTITGTVEMNGDGTALLRFEGFQKLFLINLDDGDVRDHDDEFEGRVKRVNIDANTFVLASGRTIKLSEEVEISDDSDVTRLEQVGRAIEDGAHVKAEGSGSVEGDQFIATEVTFEVEESDGRHFEGWVNRINLDTGILTFNEEDHVRFGEKSIISESGDLLSLAGVKEALENGYQVKIIGYGKADENSDAELLVVEAKFQTDRKEFEGHVTAVHPDLGTFTIGGELTIQINDNTTISQEGNLYNLTEVAEALEMGYDVVAFGGGIRTNDTETGLLANKVTFKVRSEQFEGHITGVSLDAGTFTINQELTIRVGDNTIVSESGNLYSLQEAAEALEAGADIVAYGSGKISSSTDSKLIANEVVFKAQHEEFEGNVTAVNLETGTFTLDEELTIRVGEETIISESGEFHTLGAVAEALEQGQAVVAFGDGIYDRATDARILAAEVRFELTQ
ncbi:hypothetical protein NC796_07045 [Aliifodinibius sp. S!AR15-10]|uniref:hypothetical protein n=1 Tax=Aliifodinibius sp. S!AR15-10 TaxID=2950437 RepID=UPI0028648080|nr:hypothetical protein [Aliifodinibius sp. S!AR15-10]MDR8390886.1 hypothetical protein [Aliifodinibius sp. S!AR15-10]